jgi:hypothetical protein
MASVRLVDLGTHVEVQTTEPLTVEQVSFDWAVSLLLSGTGDFSFLVRLGSKFMLDSGNGTQLVVTPPASPEHPEEPIAVLGLWRSAVRAIRATHVGDLTIEFADGRTLAAPSSADYEAWEISGPSGLLLVTSFPTGACPFWSAVNNQHGQTPASHLGILCRSTSKRPQP